MARSGKALNFVLVLMLVLLALDRIMIEIDEEVAPRQNRALVDMDEELLMFNR